MSAQISYRDTIKFIRVLPGTWQSLRQEVRELFGDTLPAHWSIVFFTASTGEKKSLNQDEYGNILLASTSGEKIEFYIEGPEESIKNLDFTISRYDLISENKNKEKSFAKILDDLSSDEEQKEEPKKVKPTDNGEKRLPNVREDSTPQDGEHRSDFPQNPAHRSNLHQGESQELSEVEALEQKLREGLKPYHLTTLGDLEEELESQRKEHERLLKNGREKNAAKVLETIQDLESLQQLFGKIAFLKKTAASGPANQKLQDLEKELREGLQKQELDNLEQVNEELEVKRKEHAKLLSQDRKTQAAKLEPTIQELKRLQELFAEIEVIKQSILDQASVEKNGRIAELERELNEGLTKHELKRLDQVIEELELKRKGHAKLLSQDRKTQAAKLEPTIQELECLQQLFIQIESLKQPSTVGSKTQIFELERELKEGLQKHELTNLVQVNEEFDCKREQYEDLLRNGRQGKAAELLPTVQDLERLRALFAEIEALKQPLKAVVQAPVEKGEVIPVVAAPKIIQQKQQQNQQSENDSQETVSKEKMTLRLKSLYENYHLMPDCVERSLQALIYYSLLMTLKNKEVLSKIQIPENLDKEITQAFENFKNRIRAEDNYISNVDHKLQRWQAKIDRGEFESLKEECTLTMNELRPLNIQELLKLLKEGEKTVDLIQNEDVILLLGGTGSGKSTSIHFLAGSLMKKDGDHIYPDPEGIPNPAAKTVRTSSASVSETRYIHAVPVDLYKLDPAFEGKARLWRHSRS